MTQGLERLSAGFLRVAGKTAIDGSGKGTPGFFKTILFEDIPRLVMRLSTGSPPPSTYAGAPTQDAPPGAPPSQQQSKNILISSDKTRPHD